MYELMAAFTITGNSRSKHNNGWLYVVDKRKLHSPVSHEVSLSNIYVYRAREREKEDGTDSSLVARWKSNYFGYLQVWNFSTFDSCTTCNISTVPSMTYTTSICVRVLIGRSLDDQNTLIYRIAPAEIELTNFIRHGICLSSVFYKYFNEIGN